MANPPLPNEIWHLTIDDLLEPLPEAPRLGGTGPFVINLSASTAPISVPMKGIADHPGAHVYQIQRIEDRRLRYRLRFGPFETEDEADAVLATVREVYPSALTATAETDDLRVIESIKAKIEAQQLAAVKAAVSKAQALPHAPLPSGVAQTQASAPVDEVSLPSIASPAWLPPTETAADTSAIPVLSDCVEVAAQPGDHQRTPPTFAAAFGASMAPAASAVIAPATAALDLVPDVASPATARERRIEALSTPLSSLESTQTLRPLTPVELQDASALRWFAIQLATADESFDPDTLPNLDIFSEYRLYSVAGTEQGKVRHALRLGFFAEESAAAAVAAYLAAFYDKPLVKRVSVAERTRFSQQRVEARKDIGATGRHAVIEITNERVVRPKRAANSTHPRSPGVNSTSTKKR